MGKENTNRERPAAAKEVVKYFAIYQCRGNPMFNETAHTISGLNDPRYSFTYRNFTDMPSTIRCPQPRHAHEAVLQKVIKR